MHVEVLVGLVECPRATSAAGWRATGGCTTARCTTSLSSSAGWPATLASLRRRGARAEPLHRRKTLGFPFLVLLAPQRLASVFVTAHQNLVSAMHAGRKEPLTPVGGNGGSRRRSCAGLDRHIGSARAAQDACWSR